MMPQNPKILIVGAGAVGGYFGGLLCNAGVDITFLVRPATYAAIKENGLTIQSVNGNFTLHPNVVQSVSEVPSADYILLTVKCYDLAAVLEEIAPLVHKGAVIVTLQNGVDTEERVEAYFKRDCFVAGVVYITARLAKPGVIEHFRRGVISLGEYSGAQSERVLQLVQLLKGAGVVCALAKDIRYTKWEKLCWNATFNPLSVILDHPISLILNTPSLLGLVREGIREIIHLAAAEAIHLIPDVIETTISVSGQFSAYHTSMYEDYKNGKPTEIEHLNGDLIRRGRKWGIPTPVHDTLYALIKGLEEKRRLM